MNTQVHKTKIRKIIPAIFIALLCFCLQGNISMTFPKIQLKINDGIGISMTFSNEIEKGPVTHNKNKGQNIVIIKIGKTNIFCLYGEKIEKISISTFKNLIINTKK